jgi:hypothetical protein
VGRFLDRSLWISVRENPFNARCKESTERINLVEISESRAKEFGDFCSLHFDAPERELLAHERQSVQR